MRSNREALKKRERVTSEVFNCRIPLSGKEGGGGREGEQFDPVSNSRKRRKKRKKRSQWHQKEEEGGGGRRGIVDWNRFIAF